MSEWKRIDRERFEKICKMKNIKKIDIAKHLWPNNADPASQLSRCLRKGRMDKDDFDKMCQYMDASYVYLSGECEEDFYTFTYLDEKQCEIDETGVLCQFLFSQGYEWDFCQKTKDFNVDDLSEIRKLIVSKIISHDEELKKERDKLKKEIHDEILSRVKPIIISDTSKQNQAAIEEEVQKASADILIKRLFAANCEERSDKKKPAAAKNKNKK